MIIDIIKNLRSKYSSTIFNKYIILTQNKMLDIIDINRGELSPHSPKDRNPKKFPILTSPI